MRLTLDDAATRTALLGRAPGPRPPRPDAEALRRLRRLAEADEDARSETVRADGTKLVSERGGGRSHYHHDDHGDLRRLVEPDGAATTFGYDERRRLTEVQHPDGTCTRYAYDADDRLCAVDDRGARTTHTHDAAGRLIRVRHGRLTHDYRHDEGGRLVEGRTPSVRTTQRFDDAGRATEVRQTHAGVTLAVCLEYDEQGRLTAVRPPGGAPTIHYRWDDGGRMRAITAGGRRIAAFSHDGDTVRATLGDGTVDERRVDPVDRRPLRYRVHRGGGVLLDRQFSYDDERLIGDGARRYRYDPLGRLVAVEDPTSGRSWRYRYDELDNRRAAVHLGDDVTYHYDPGGRLSEVRHAGGEVERWQHDRWGRPSRRSGPHGEQRYRYDAAGQLTAVADGDDTVAAFDYDHHGRLVAATRAGGTERYLYGPQGDLLAVADTSGRCVRVPVHTPLGVVAEIVPGDGGHAVRYLHADHLGTVHLVTSDDGGAVTRLVYGPFGEPLEGRAEEARFGGHPYVPEAGLYRAGARWYDPSTGRFLTPDSLTAAPDDARLIRPASPASAQVEERAALLDDWLRHPRLRNRYAYCGNDPVGRIDPNGRWSRGWLLLNLAGALWTSPNTLFGLLVEVACLALEVVRWLVWLVSGGRVTWEPPRFDAAASPRLNTAALVFRGGALGSFPQLHGVTFGNVFFVYGGWEDLPQYARPGFVFPAAYDCEVALPRDRALYEHLLRHTNQYGWFGPSFGPVWGVSLLLQGRNHWLVRDARRRSGL